MALSVASGMVLATTALFSFTALFFLSLIFMVGSFVFLRTRYASILIFCCIGLLSAIRCLGILSPVSDQQINRLLPVLPLAETELTGRITQPPEFYSYRSGQDGIWVFPLKCEGRKEANDWIRQRGMIQVRLSGSKEDITLRVGERLWLSGALQIREYPGHEAIELEVVEPDNFKIIGSSVWFAPIIGGQYLRGKAADILSKGIEPHPAELGVYKALLVGYRKAIPSEVYERFRQTGTLHIFAISGLHVGIVGLLIIIVLKTIGIPRNRWGIWLLPLLLFYVCSTGMKSSALRAWTMAAVYFLAPLIHRKPDVPNAVAFSAILLLWINPLDILSAGFIFSFCVVSFLVMVFSAIPQSRIAGTSGVLRPIRTYVCSLGITSLAASIASAPLAALFFGSITPVSLLGNLIVVPLTFCIVLCGWLSICIPWVAAVFNHAALIFIKGLLGSVTFFAGLPGAHASVAPPSIGGILMWYAGWIALFTVARTKEQRSYCAVLIGLGVVLSFI